MSRCLEVNVAQRGSAEELLKVCPRISSSLPVSNIANSASFPSNGLLEFRTASAHQKGIEEEQEKLLGSWGLEYVKVETSI